MLVRMIWRIALERWVLFHIVPNIPSLRLDHFQEDLPHFEANPVISCNNSCGDILGWKQCRVMWVWLWLLQLLWIQASVGMVVLMGVEVLGLPLVMKVESSSMPEEW